MEENNNQITVTEEFEGTDDTALIIDKNDRTLVTDKTDPDVDTLHNKYVHKKLFLQPEYQRNYVMKPNVASRLIESLLLDIPLPVFYFAEEKDGSWSVIDGQQRLTSIFSFIEEKFIYDLKPFKLTGLNVLTELNKKTFGELSEEQQNKILNTPLRGIVIKKESNEDIKFEIFERLNTGSTPLNEDEIRNTVYRGKYINMLGELENDETFCELIDKPNFKNRMKYRGMILRFFAFYEKSYLNYKPSIKQFCNKYLKEHQNLTDDHEKELREVFKNAVSMVNSVFGKNAFRRLIKNDDNTSSWATSRINMALYDIQMWGFTRYKKEQIIPKGSYIKEKMIDLMTSNREFIDAIELSTSDSKQVLKRFQIWQKALEEIVGDDKISERCFSYEIKKQLFEKSNICAICHQEILSIDDAHTDHILAYSKGGKTTIDNAQLTHRYCNLHKSDK